MVIQGGRIDSTQGSRQGERMRHAHAGELHAALDSGRHNLLALFDGFERALGDGLQIALDPVLNLPLWELGHVGWFEEYWLWRNPSRTQGASCDAEMLRTASVMPNADALYDSSKVPHARRWQLELPTPQATLDYLRRVRECTLDLLRHSTTSDDDLYFFRLVLFHEDMHREAWHFMAQQLGVDLGAAMLGRSPTPSTQLGEWHIPAGMRHLGSDGTGFAFDNELQSGQRWVDAFSIDRAPVSWRQFLQFVEDGGYDNEAIWSAHGWAWRTAQARAYPRHLRRVSGGWEQQRFGRWLTLDLAAPAIHVSAHEAQAWCRWASRRLPTESEWETAATLAEMHDEGFEWGQVWEWTSSRFEPYGGFVAHPYMDYSQPWFDGRPVLRGASFATMSHMKHARYRNFFTVERDDVFAGFRSCVN
jgi:gamma-glutamyl hercynylcysteine S-oxide synthase